ncbi:hypothetical protein [Archangium lipolyticum]|uniref:hypothetical protein n=1 Tax=Archangium lipolyticum TaxID=2970465 RepID=UPI00214A0AB1|nr:hypothetical protein [Archangium lipolyticum]
MKQASIFHPTIYQRDPESHSHPHETLMQEFEHQFRTSPTLHANQSERELPPLFNWALDELHLLRTTLKYLSASEATAELQLLMRQIREKLAE